MTTATKTQPTKLFFDCGHAELKPLDATEYRHVSVAGPCTACRQAASSSGITLSNFRVEYRAPKYEDGRVLYDGYCAILADDAEHGEVRVFDVPDVDEGQLAAAMFACDAMNQHDQLISLIKQLREFACLSTWTGTLKRRSLAREAETLVKQIDAALATTTSK